EQKLDHMDCHQMGIQPGKMNGQANSQCTNPSDPGITFQATLQQRKKKVEKKNTSQEPLAHTSKVCTNPSGRYRKIIQAQYRQQQGRGFGCRIIAGFCDKTNGKAYDPSKPKQRINRLCTL